MIDTFYLSADRWGEKIFVRERTNAGTTRCNIIPYQPHIYVEDLRSKEGWQTMTGTPLTRIQFESIKHAARSIKDYLASGVAVHGMEVWESAYINETWQNAPVPDVDKIKVCFLDIETTSDGGFPDTRNPVESLTAVTLYDRTTDEYLAVGLGEFIVPQRWRNVRYAKAADEAALIKIVISFIRNRDIDVLSGWYSDPFDVPYFIARAYRVIGDRATAEISPFRKIKPPREVRFDHPGSDETYITYPIVGLPTLDYRTVYRKFSGKNQESYSLENIAQVELGKGKLDYSQWGTIHDIHLKNHQIFMEYNIEDVMRLAEIDAKRRLMRLALNLAYTAKVNYPDVLKQTKMWDSIIYGKLLAKGVIVPLKRGVADKDEKFRGAFVIDPESGAFEDVVSFDLDALYPNIIIQCNISPETLIPELQMNMGVEDIDVMLRREWKSPYPEHVVTPNGSVFRKDKEGYIPAILKEMLMERKHFKDIMLERERQVNMIDNELKRRAG